jgi:hypothetical protein
MWAGSLAGQATATNVPELPLSAVQDFFKLPEGLYLGESMGIAQNSKGQIYIMHRSGDTRLFEFDRNGNFVKEIAPGFYGFEFAHKVRIDKDDNIWTVDEGATIVTKFNPQGRVLMILGSRPEPVHGGIPSFSGPGPNHPYLFARPTDVTWDTEGNIFVSDGYFNHRVVKYSPDGRYMGQVGTGQSGNAIDQFNTPHTIGSDSQGNIYVGDRGNNRVKVYDNQLRLKTMFVNVGSPWELCVSPPPNEFLFVSNSNPDNQNAASWATSGEIYKMKLDGTIIGKFGKAGKEPGNMQTVHGMDCRNPNELLVSEISAWRAQKLRVGSNPVSMREQQ